jgi:hypothetical protein
LAFVRTVDEHSRERVRGVLSAFGGQNRTMEVFTDGDTPLPQWQLKTLPRVTHILDWYHLRRRISQLNAVVHSKATASQLKTVNHDRLSELAGGLKWRPWHGRSAKGRRRLEAMLHVLGRPEVACRPAVPLIRKLTIELLGYLRNNADSLPDYGRRYRAGRRISSAFAESAVNQLIDKRMSKSQQMRGDPQSAHLLLQVRVRVVVHPMSYPAFFASFSNPDDCGHVISTSLSSSLPGEVFFDVLGHVANEPKRVDHGAFLVAVD